ncbi:hypothetical protein SLEP1_g55229 [Rubroshorea leprosula]|uniref:Uncharacterized protein n=1 Tax=Rubroshorea leprosula TaxID=152421 RepID=A0AAV5MF36_9ROSI|nr:hypothetical protein SLEP1_g55229 [Rubroshorea leprosula]
MSDRPFDFSEKLKIAHSLCFFFLVKPDYCEMSLHVDEVARENELLKYDESEYLLMAEISPVGFDTLFSKLKEVKAEERQK